MQRVPFVAGLIAAIAAAPQTATAQSAMESAPAVRFGLGGGATFPVGDLADETNPGAILQGSLAFRAPFVPIGLRADAFAQRLPDDHGGRFNEYGGLLSAVLGPTRTGVRPYVVGGVGFVMHNPPDEVHDDHVHEGEDETTFAYAVGGGLQFSLMRTQLFVEARYLDAGAGHQSVPVTIGVTF